MISQIINCQVQFLIALKFLCVTFCIAVCSKFSFDYFFHHKRICEILKWRDLYPCQTYVWFVLFFSIERIFDHLSIVPIKCGNNVSIWKMSSKILSLFPIWILNILAKELKWHLSFLQKLAAKCVKTGGSYFKNCAKQLLSTQFSRGFWEKFINWKEIFVQERIFST